MLKIQIFVKLLLESHVLIITNCTLNRYTGNNDDGQGNVIFLDRHTVKCGDGEALSGFQFYRPYEGGIGILYSCFRSGSILPTIYNDATLGLTQQMICLHKNTLVTDFLIFLLNKKITTDSKDFI